MQKTRLFELINSLSEKEFLNAEAYLIHFTEARQKCIALYKCFKENYIANEKNWLKACPKKEDVLIKLFKKNIKNQNTSLAVLCNELCSYLLEYFAFVMHQQSDKDMEIQQYFFERNMFDSYKKHKKKIEKKMTTKIGGQTTYKKAQLVEIDIEFESNYYTTKPNLNFEELFFAFKEYNYIKQLKNYCILLNSSLIVNQAINAEIQKEMSALLKLKSLKKYQGQTLFKLYKICIEMLQKLPGRYKVLKNELYNTQLNIEIEDHRTIRNAMLTYCNNMMYQPGKKSLYFREEHLLNYFYMYENNLLNTGKYLPVMYLKNICSLAVIRTKEKGRLFLSEDEVYQLIEDSYEKVIPKHQQSTYSFNIGVWNFYKKQYSNAIKILSTSNTYANAFFNYDSRTILLRCYYILNDFEIVEKQAIAAKEALRREKQLSIRHKTEYRYFFIFIEKLSRIKNEHKYVFRPSIQQKLIRLKELIAEKPTKLRGWLLNEIELIQV